MLQHVKGPPLVRLSLSIKYQLKRKCKMHSYDLDKTIMFSWKAFIILSG